MTPYMTQTSPKTHMPSSDKKAATHDSLSSSCCSLSVQLECEEYCSQYAILLGGTEVSHSVSDGWSPCKPSSARGARREGSPHSWDPPKKCLRHTEEGGEDEEVIAAVTYTGEEMTADKLLFITTNTAAAQI